MNDVDVVSWQYKATGGVTSTAIVPNKSWLAVGTLAKSVVLLNWHGQLIWEQAAQNEIWHVACGNGFIAAASGSTRPWDMSGRGLHLYDEAGNLRWFHDLQTSIRTLSVAPHADLILVGTSDCRVIAYDPDGQQQWCYQIEGVGWYAWPWAIASSPNAETIAVGSAKKSLLIFDRDGHLLFMAPAGGDIFTVAVSDSGQRIASADRQGHVTLWDNRGRQLWREKHPGKIWNICISPAGTEIIVGSEQKKRRQKDEHLTVYNEQGEILLRRHMSGATSAVASSADEKRMIVGTYANQIKIMHQEGQVLCESKASKIIRDVTISRSGEFAAAGSEDSFVYGYRLSLPAQDRQAPLRKIAKSFGRLLRFYRTRARDSQSKRALSQAKLADYLSNELAKFDDGYTPQAVSNWERDVNRISANDRQVIIALLKVLYANEGIIEIGDADDLLDAGGFSRLDPDERAQIFGPATHL